MRQLLDLGLSATTAVLNARLFSHQTDKIGQGVPHVTASDFFCDTAIASGIPPGVKIGETNAKSP